MVTFNELDRLPEGFLNATAQSLHGLLPPATLVHLPGVIPRPLLVSVLLHGNEDAGLKAVQQVLRQAAGQPLQRALSIFFGNVEAARHNVRFLPSQPDFNRIWSDSHADSPYGRMAQAVVKAMLARGVFAVLDLHNNTGRNPLYSCISPSDHAAFKLAALFSEIAVRTGTISGTLTGAFAPHCPAITCECGEIGNAEGVRRAAGLVEQCLGLTSDGLAEVDDSRLTTYEAFATIAVPDGLGIAVGGPVADDGIQLSPDIDLLNFRELPAGFSLAKAGRNLHGEALLALDDRGMPMTGVFVRDGDDVRLAEASTPAMLTPHEDAIRKTCLGYLMRRLPPAATTPDAASPAEPE